MGFSTRQASFFLALRPLLGSVCAFTFYPRFVRKYGPERALLFSFGWPLVFVIYLVLSSAAQAGLDQIYLIVGLLLAFCGSAVAMPMYLSCEQLIAKRAPKGYLARICAADEILANVVREVESLFASYLSADSQVVQGGGLGAAFGPSLFAATLGKGVIASKSVWLVFMLLGALLALACARVNAIPGEEQSDVTDGLEEVEGLLQDSPVPNGDRLSTSSS